VSCVRLFNSWKKLSGKATCKLPLGSSSRSETMATSRFSLVSVAPYTTPGPEGAPAFAGLGRDAVVGDRRGRGHECLAFWHRIISGPTDAPSKPEGPEGRGAIGVAATYSPTLKHTSTDFRSESESLPIHRTSRWGRVTGNSLKYDAACSSACLQSRNVQSVGANGFGACVVIGPTTSGLCRG